MKLLQAKRVSGTRSFWHVSAVMNGLPDISSVKRHGLLPGTIRSFFALYVQTPAESTERIPLATQRHLLNHFKLVTELGGEVIQVSSSDIMGEIIKTCRQRGITTVCMGHPAFKMPGALFSLSKYRKFLHSLAEMDIDLIILA